MNEIWKPIKGYEGIYEVSSFGRVRSLDRIVPALNALTGTIVDYFRKGRIKRQQPINNGEGYMVVSLTDADHKSHTYLVHRLVAMAFVPGYFDGADVNHKDEDPSNNRADNLEWCDRKYNINYGTGKWRRRKFNERRVEQLTLDGQHIAYHQNMSYAARAVGCDPSTIASVCKGKHGKKNCISAKGFKWKWADDGTPLPKN